MAGTFTVVGLAAAALIAGLVSFLIKRHRKLRDEEEVDEYFDKLPSLGQHHAEMSRSSPDLIPPTLSIAPDIHHGSTDGFYPDSRNYGLDYPPEMVSSSDSRPASVAPGTAYAAAIAREGPYQYTGRSAHDHDNNAAAESPVANFSRRPSRHANQVPQPHDIAYAYDPFSGHI
jgi:hypothetical protein